MSSDNAAPIQGGSIYDAMLVVNGKIDEVARLTEERDAARSERDRMCRHWTDRNASAEIQRLTEERDTEKLRADGNFESLERVKGKYSEATAELSALRAELAETRERSNKNHDVALGFQNRALNAESLLASATDLMNTCAREWNVAQEANESGIKDLFDRLWSEMSCRYFDKRDDEAKANQDAVALRAELEAVRAETKELQTCLDEIKSTRNATYVDGFGLFGQSQVVKLLEARAELVQARVRLKEAEQDTNRLDWLENKWVSDESSPLTEYEGQWHADGMPNGPMTDDMRSAIDAAISQTVQPEEKR